MRPLARHFLALTVTVIFLIHTAIPVCAQQSVLPWMPAPGVMLAPSIAYSPVLLYGVKVDPVNPFAFEFVIDSGDGRLTGQGLEEESMRLVRYFFTALTVPEDDLWVNLSPYERDRIVPDGFGQTDMGRDLLALDYLLKQITSSLLYPEDAIGAAFWERVYAEAYAKYGTTDIPVDTFNKVWIVPESATIYEDGNVAFVGGAHLKVMLEEDYQAIQYTRDEGRRTTDEEETNRVHRPGEPSERWSIVHRDRDVNSIGAQIVREIIIPELEKEINTGKNFAKLRQIYYTLILSTWYKQRMARSILGQKYVDRNTILGVDIEDKTVKDKIYQQYLDAFGTGVYDYIREELDPATQQIIPRKYFSGGAEMRTRTVTTSEPLTREKTGQLQSNMPADDYSLRVVGSEPLLPISAPAEGTVTEETPDPEFKRSVNRFAEEAYAAVRPYMEDTTTMRGQEPHVCGTCVDVVRNLYDKLQSHARTSAGPFTVDHVVYQNSRIFEEALGTGFEGLDTEENAGQHHFLIAEHQGRFWLVDPTWQQFVRPENRAGLDKVLLVELKEFAGFVSKAGVVDSPDRHVWQNGVALNPALLARIRATAGYEDFRVEGLLPSDIPASQLASTVRERQPGKDIRVVDFADLFRPNPYGVSANASLLNETFGSADAIIELRLPPEVDYVELERQTAALNAWQGSGEIFEWQGRNYTWGFVLAELIKNAFVHGNHLKTDRSIYVYANMADSLLEVYDSADSAEPSAVDLNRARDARLWGRGQAINAIRHLDDLKYERVLVDGGAVSRVNKNGSRPDNADGQELSRDAGSQAVGGIDLDTAGMALTIESIGPDFNIQHYTQGQLDSLEIHGLTPTIISIQPQSLFQFIGYH